MIHETLLIAQSKAAQYSKAQRKKLTRTRNNYNIALGYGGLISSGHGRLLSRSGPWGRHGLEIVLC
jgi:hypothetical protein